MDNLVKGKKNSKYGDFRYQGVDQTVGIVCNLAKIESIR